MTTTASEHFALHGPRYVGSGTVDGRDFYVTADNRTALLRKLPLHWHFPALTVGDHASIRFNGGTMRVERTRA
jgi:hypothetical protein